MRVLALIDKLHSWLASSQVPNYGYEEHLKTKSWQTILRCQHPKTHHHFNVLPFAL